MSSLPLHTTPATNRPRPALRVVRSPRGARSVAGYLLLCATILLAALVTALLLNTHMAVAAYDIHDAQQELNQLEEEEGTLRQQVEEAGTPSRLAERADELGMIPAEEIGYVSLTDGELHHGKTGEGQ